METTGRGDGLGVDLHAPQLNGAGRPEWGYALVAETRPGDVVFHWHKSRAGRPALVGWSVIAGPLSVAQDYTWMPQGTRGRARGVPTVGLGWRMPCTGYTALDQPIDGRALARHEDQLKLVAEELKAQVRGATYFPFTFYRPGEIRSSQSYLTKFPAALLDLFPELVPAASTSLTGDLQQVAPPSSRGGRMQDVRARLAIEQYAVQRARQYYVELGASRIEELGKPFDLIVYGLGAVRHVEVKGSTAAPLAAVELTVNEVAHADNHQPTDLVVVDHIELNTSSTEAPIATGGRLQVWTDWTPAEAALSPTRYSYELPSSLPRVVQGLLQPRLGTSRAVGGG
jgi:hypothetical protein